MAAPPWERRGAYPRHPVGRVRRRWPRAYDGAEPVDRYRRSYEQERRADRRRGTRSRMSMESLRQTPLRSGLIGLAVAGTAAPIAVNRYQQAMRTDPSHEVRMAHEANPATDSSVMSTWRTLDGDSRSAEAGRENTITAMVDLYAEYNLTREMAEEIYDSALENDLEPEVAFGLVRAESSFRNGATSYVGAIGLTQLMPATAKWLEKGITNSELRDSETNLRIGFRYLRQLIDKYEGNTDLALVAYNRGPGTVDRIISRGGDPDNGYAEFVKTGERGEHRIRS